MSKTIVGSQKFSSLEIVDSAKFDNEIVYEDLIMSGSSISLICSEDVTISSTGTQSPWGVNILSVGPITSSSTESENLVLSGFNDGVSPSSGVVGLGHSTGTGYSLGFSVEYDSLSNQSKIGAFGVVPVEQPDNTIQAATPFAGNSSGIVDDSATYGGYTVGQLVAAMKSLGFLA